MLRYRRLFCAYHLPERCPRVLAGGPLVAISLDDVPSYASLLRCGRRYRLPRTSLIVTRISWLPEDFKSPRTFVGPGEGRQIPHSPCNHSVSALGNTRKTVAN